MKQKKSILKEITATVMPQTEEGLQTLMEQTGLTIGEVIDRLALQIYPEKPEQAILLAEEQVIFSLTKLTEKQTEKALTEIIIFFGRVCTGRAFNGITEESRCKPGEEFRAVQTGN